MNIQYTHMILISLAAKLQTGNDVFENGLMLDGNEGVITDVWTDYSC